MPIVDSDRRFDCRPLCLGRRNLSRATHRAARGLGVREPPKFIND
jgi:hypothetical protein